MNHLHCLKITDINSLIKKLEKIKIIIKDCLKDRINFDAKDCKELDKKITLYKKKYVILHNKLYNIVENLLNCRCCVTPDHTCNKDSCCLNTEENKKIWTTIDEIHNELYDFYKEIEIGLVLETEIIFHKLNKIKKISFL